MHCPVCGGDRRDPVAPGYWRCASVVTETAWTTGPDPRYPPSMGVMGPIPTEVQRICGHEYHEANPGDDAMGDRESCSCGIFAIGRCAECQQPLCGRHGADRKQRFVCQRCRVRLDEEDAAAAAQAAAEQDAVAQEKFAAEVAHVLADLRQRLLRVTDPTERMLRLWDALNDEPLHTAYSNQKRLLASFVSDVSGDSQRSPLRLKPESLQWHLDRGGLMQWVADKTKTPSARYSRHESVNGFFRGTRKLDSLAGWRIGSATRSDNDSYRSSSWTVDIVFLIDGTVAEPRAGQRKIMSYQPQRPIGMGDLRTVGQLVGIF